MKKLNIIEKFSLALAFYVVATACYELGWHGADNHSKIINQEKSIPSNKNDLR